MAKLPSPQKVDRLYWLEEWTQSRIARKFKCASQSVSRFMQRHCLKTRGRRRRTTAECVEPGCEEMTARIRRWNPKRGHYRIVGVNRCARHYHEQVRRWNREARRRERGSQSRYTYAVATGILSVIVKEDDERGVTISP